MRKPVVVIGLGRFGSKVSTSLYNLGHDVLAIDKNIERTQLITGQVTHPVTGDATNENVLRELGVQDYDAAVIAIGTDIVASVMTTVLLKTMGISYVVARARDELHTNTLTRLGVDKVVQAESEMGIRIAHNLFNPNVQEYLEITPNFGLSKIKVPKSFANKTLNEMGFSGPRNKYGLAVLALQRGKDITLNPDSDDRLLDGDTIILAGKDELIDELPE